jgi:hypothetical protein
LGLARYAIPQDRTDKARRHFQRGPALPEWCGQDIDGGPRAVRKSGVFRKRADPEPKSVHRTGIT